MTTATAETKPCEKNVFIVYVRTSQLCKSGQISTLIGLKTCSDYTCSDSAVALLSTTGKCLVSRTIYYVSISLLFTFHFNAFFTV